MTLGTQLLRIAEAPDSERQTLAEKFSQKIKGHPEEELVRGCLKQAILGRDFLDFGRGLFIPQSLIGEDFHLEVAGSGYHLHFG